MSNWRSTKHRLARLTPGRLASLAGVTCLLLAVRAALVLLPYRVVEKSLRPRHGGASSRRRIDEERTIWAVEAAGRRLLGSRPCLVQALAARWLLGRQNIPTRLRIGVAKNDERFAAHAWLERDGEVIIGGATSPARFRVVEPIV